MKKYKGLNVPEVDNRYNLFLKDIQFVHCQRRKSDRECKKCADCLDDPRNIKMFKEWYKKK